MVHQARKRFGQHFLADESVVDSIVRAIDPQPGDAMVEIGPGLSALTAPLLDRLDRLTVVELDRDLARRLRGRWGEDRLLYDSGLVKAPGVVKPELDIRGLSRLSLRTLGAQGSQPAQVCGNWANAVLIGEEGDSADFVAP